jgi:hypothetical protein
MARQLTIGIERGKPVGSERTRAQIAAAKRLRCDLVVPGAGRLRWRDFDDPDDPESIFQRILRDRLGREAVDGAVRVEPGPLPCAVLTVEGRRVVRLEFLERIEFRAPDLEGRPLRPGLSFPGGTNILVCESHCTCVDPAGAAGAE